MQIYVIVTLDLFKVIQSLWKLFWVSLSYLESIDNELTKGFSSDTHQSSTSEIKQNWKLSKHYTQSW